MGIDPKQILADIEHIERTGNWPSPIPAWVVEVAAEVRANGYGSGVVIQAGYERAAKAAVTQADELRSAYAVQCGEHMGTIALASRLSAALEHAIGADAVRRIVEGIDAIPVYGGAIMGTDTSAAKVDTANSVVSEHAMAAINKIIAELEHFGVKPAELRIALDTWTTTLGAAGRHFEDVLIQQYEARHAKLRKDAGGKSVGSHG